METLIAFYRWNCSISFENKMKQNGMSWIHHSADAKIFHCGWNVLHLLTGKQHHPKARSPDPVAPLFLTPSITESWGCPDASQ